MLQIKIGIRFRRFGYLSRTLLSESTFALEASFIFVYVKIGLGFQL